LIWTQQDWLHIDQNRHQVWPYMNNDDVFSDYTKPGTFLTMLVLRNFEFPKASKILAPCRRVGEFQRIEETYCVHLLFYPKRAGYFLETTYHIRCCFIQEEHNMRELSDLTLFLVNSLHFFFPFVIRNYIPAAVLQHLLLFWETKINASIELPSAAMHTQDRHVGKFVVRTFDVQDTIMLESRRKSVVNVTKLGWNK